MGHLEPPPEPQAIDVALTIARARALGRTGEGRRVREAAGLKLAEMARAVGVTISAMRKYEQGEMAAVGDRARQWVAVCAALAALVEAEQGAAS